MKKLIFIVFLFLNVFDLPLGSEQSDFIEKNIQSDIVFSLGGDIENEDFYRPRYFCVDKLGSIYILDSGNCRIQVFSSEGKFLFTFGDSGQGPGELTNSAHKLKILSDGNIYLIDNRQKRITVFSKKGKYLNSFKVDKAYDDIIKIDNNYYLSNIILSSSHKPIHCTSDFENIKQSFGQIIEPTPGIIKQVQSLPSPYNHIQKNEFINIGGYTNLIANSSGEIIYSQQNPYHLVRYDQNGSKLSTKKGNVDFKTHFPLTIEFKENRLKKHVKTPFSHVLEMIPVNQNEFIVPVAGPDKSFFYLDVYNSDFKQTSRYTLPNTFYEYKKPSGFTNIVIDENNYFYGLVVSRDVMPKFIKAKLIIN